MEVAEEESDVPEIEESPFEWPEWSGYIRHAWNVLRDDRFYGAMGGMGTIYYTAIRSYASDNGIPLYPFLTLLRAMDETFVAVCAEKQKEAEAVAKTTE